MNENRVIFWAGTAFLLCLVLGLLSGCEVSDRAILSQQLEETQREIARIKLAATTQPLSTGEARRIDELERTIRLLQAALAQQPTAEGIGAVLRAIPGVGPYADLIGLALGGILGFFAKRAQARRELGIVLSQWHNEDKPGTTPALDSAIAMTGVQPTPTKV